MAENENGTAATTLEEALAEIEKLKETSVPREEYDKERENNRTLLKKIVDGRYDEEEDEDPDPEPVDLKKAAKAVTSGNLPNLEYARRALAYRDACIEQGKGDPFLPIGEHAERASTDAGKADRVAELLRHCVEYADEAGGDNEVFTNELTRHLVDPPEVLALLATRRPAFSR